MYGKQKRKELQTKYTLGSCITGADIAAGGDMDVLQRNQCRNQLYQGMGATDRLSCSELRKSGKYH